MSLDITTMFQYQSPVLLRSLLGLIDGGEEATQGSLSLYIQTKVTTEVVER
jgi:hypothetical protein